MVNLEQLIFSKIHVKIIGLIILILKKHPEAKKLQSAKMSWVEVTLYSSFYIHQDSSSVVWDRI